MSFEDLSGRVLILRPDDRLFEYIKHFCTILASVGIAAQYYVDGRIENKPGDYVIVESSQSKLQLRVPINGPIQAAIFERTVGSIELRFEEVTKPPHYRIWTSGYQELLRHIISPIFVDFYENSIDSFEEKFGGRDGSQWPKTLDFARVVRNSCSHGGKLFFRNKNNRSVSWRDIQYGPQDHGKVVICGELSIADIIILMIDINDELAEIM